MAAISPAISLGCMSSEKQADTVEELYQNLNIAKREIRLLQILPATGCGTGYDRLTCTLVTTSLDAGAEYDALSYTWGEPGDEIPITVNGLSVPVRRTLHEVLIHFREIETFREKFLWIDALCINQHNVTERNQQVSMMGSIYSGARLVRAWIGSRTPHIDRAMVFLNSLGKHELDDRWANLWNLDDEELDALAEFFARDWWDRTWVIQEVTLAKQPFLCCGNLALPFRAAVLQPHAKIMVETTKDSVNANKAARPERTQKVGRVMARLVHFSFADSILARQSKGVVLDRDVVNVLAKAARCKATDPRDRIIGLLGLLPPSVGLTPDYAKAIEDGYEEATLKIINSTNSLDILHLSGLSKRTDYHTGQSQPSELPTWVPEFRRLWYGGFIPHGKFNACINCRALVGDWPKGELYVHAIRLSRVQESDTCTLDSPFRGLADHKLKLREWREMSNRTAIGRFWRTVTDGVVLRNGVPFEWSEILEIEATELYEQYDVWLSGNDSALHGIQGYQLAPALSDSLVHGQRSFFVSNDAAVGVARGVVEAGDVVAVLAGFAWPVVLRPVIKSHGTKYQLISSCCVDGTLNLLTARHRL